MSDEQRKDDETEVEGHWHRAGANDDTAKDEPEPDDEVEGHMHRAG